MSRKRAVAVLISAAAFAATLPSAASAALPAPSDVGFDLQGCNLQTGENLVAQSFVCQQYANGNFGKNWAELDLVPHRLEAKGKKNSGSTVLNYTVAIAGDNEDGGDPGWDHISTPVINDPLSDPSCTVSAAATQIANPGVQGADKTIYRVLTISHEEDETCVIDWYQRLALGSAAFPGSSLQSYLLSDDLSSPPGHETLPIPVNAAQGLSKTMDAQHDKTYPWNITKTAPARVDFTSPCVASTREAPVTIRIEWTRMQPVDADTVRVVTNISATNPAARPINVQVTDEILSGATSLDTDTLPVATVPANTTTTVATHTFDVPVAQAVNLNDVATATYTDPVTNAPIAGNTTATATALVQPGGFINDEATITDDETITGNGLSFRVDSVSAGSANGVFKSGPGGLLGALTLPTPAFSATDPAGAGGTIFWESDPQTSSGFVEFNKTIILAGDISTTGTLSDTANLNASDGFAAAPATASTDIASTACGKVVVDKATTPAGAPDSFDFTGGSIAPFNGGSNTLSATDAQNAELTVPTGSYSLTEAAKAGWSLTGLTCDDGQSQTPSTPNAGTGEAVYNVDSGETVTCRWANTGPEPAQQTQQQEQQQQQQQPEGQQEVLGERVSPGSARFAGVSGCQGKPFTVRVKGRSINRVEFSIDGKKRKTVTRPDSAGRYKFRVDPRKFKPGSHRLVARAVFDPASGTRPKSMAMRFSRCVRAAQAPAFTG